MSAGRLALVVYALLAAGCLQEVTGVVRMSADLGYEIVDWDTPNASIHRFAGYMTVHVNDRVDHGAVTLGMSNATIERRFELARFSGSAPELGGGIRLGGVHGGPGTYWPWVEPTAATVLGHGDGRWFVDANNDTEGSQSPWMPGRFIVFPDPVNYTPPQPATDTGVGPEGGDRPPGDRPFRAFALIGPEPGWERARLFGFVGVHEQSCAYPVDGDC